MHELTIINQNGQLLVDSREVAEMIGKSHSDLLQEIDGRQDGKNVGIIPALEKGNFPLSNYFIESKYESGTRTYKCYLITKMGCELLGNKQQGEKGILFTAKYVQAFNEMERQLQAPALDNLSPQLQLLINMELEQKRMQQQLNEVNAKAEEAKQGIQGIRDVVSLSPNAWRTETTAIINKIAQALGGFDHIKDVREESYKLLDERAGAKLGIRLTNRKRRVLEETGSKSKADKVSKLDCIADDKRLTEVYLAIVKEMAIKYEVA